MNPVGTDDHHQSQAKIQCQRGYRIGDGGDEAGFHIHGGQAAGSGGNVEGSKPDEIVITPNGVTIIGNCYD